MLDHDDQEQLDKIAARWWAEDARFARGIEQGKPTSPREYRSRTVGILACLGLLALVFGLVTESMAPILSGLVACVVASTVYSCRSLDNPTRRD
jgi:hypothetical protein